MNPQHKINRRNNRIKRLARRIVEVEADKKVKITEAENKYEPDLSWHYKKLKSLKQRQDELESIQ